MAALMGLQSPGLLHVTMSPMGTNNSSPSCSISEAGSSGVTDYFSARPRTQAQRPNSMDSRHWGPHSRQSSAPQRDNTEHMNKLVEDANILARGGASRWRRVATTMPRSLWKPDGEASTCDHLALSGGACEKPFGHFIGKYRLPAVATNTFTTIDEHDEDASSSSALWGSIKINRRHHCHRCGNCFCDNHSSKYATLILDAEDAPQLSTSFEGKPEDDTMLASGSSAMASHAAIVETPLQRTASDCLSQYLSASAPGHKDGGASTVSNIRNRKQNNAQASIQSSAVGSIDSQDSDSWSSLSGSSNLAESLRSHGVSRSAAPSGFSQDTRATSVSSQVSTVNSSSAASAALQSVASSAAVAHMPLEHTAITQLADGCYIVRERVCSRCHDIVDQARTKTLNKQSLRNQQADEAQPRRSSDPAVQMQGEQEDYLLSLQRLYVDYRCERKKRLTNARSASTDAVTRVTSNSKLYPLAPPPPRAARRHTGKVVTLEARADSEDEEDDEEEDDGQRRGHAAPRAHHVYFPSFTSHEDQHQYGNPNATRPQAPMPKFGMGGQRLQFALAGCQ